jgi:hypothetical protein
LATLTRVLSPSAQTTLASTRALLGLSGSMAVTVPLAKGPRLVGAGGPLPMAVDCRKARVNLTVSSICSAELTGLWGNPESHESCITRLRRMLRGYCKFRNGHARMTHGTWDYPKYQG